MGVDDRTAYPAVLADGHSLEHGDVAGVPEIKPLTQDDLDAIAQAKAEALKELQALFLKEAKKYNW